MKARLCPNGNRDRLKKAVRKDSATAHFDVIRLILSLATQFLFRMGCIDIKGAYLQSGLINRCIYVRPPMELDLPRYILWKLRKPPYRITEAGRQWAKEIDSWPVNSARFTRLLGMSQIYIKRTESNQILLIAVKVTDGLLIAGKIDILNGFAEEISRRYKVRKIIIEDLIRFNGRTIMQDNRGNIQMNMNEFLLKVNSIKISKARRKQTDERATKEEVKELRSLAGSLLWLGAAVLPQASLTASFMQQKVARLLVRDLIDANNRLKHLRETNAKIKFNVADKDNNLTVYSFSDASFNISSYQSYGQTGKITGLAFDANVGRRIFHPIDWTSSKQRWVSHS